MRNGILILLNLLMCQLTAQSNPGFLGHKNVVYGGISLHPFDMVVNAKSVIPVGVGIDHSVGRAVSFGIYYRQYTSRMYAGEFYGEDLEWVKDHNTSYSQSISANGDITASHHEVNLNMKIFLQQYGALSPLGMHLNLETGLHMWNFSQDHFYGTYQDGADVIVVKGAVPNPGNAMTFCGGLGRSRVWKGRVTLSWDMLTGGLVYSSADSPNGYVYAESKDVFVNRHVHNTLGIKYLWQWRISAGYIL